MTCELSYPSQILKKDSPLFDEILTDKGLLDLKDPTTNIPREKLVAATNALNKAFNGINNVTGLPVNYPYEAFANDYPVLADKLLQTGPVANVEAALFSNDYGLNVDDIASTMDSYVPGSLPTQKFRDICEQLDAFYNKNMGAALSGGLCGAFPNIFGKLAQVIAVVESVKGLIDDIKNFNPEDFINGLVAQIIGPLKAIAEAIKSTIDNLIKSFKKAAKQIAEDVKNFAKDLKAGATKIMNKVKNAVRQVLDFLAEPNMDKLKEGVESLVTGAASAFEKMDLQTLALLMFRFCQLAGAVQAFMKKPLDGLAQMVVGLKAAQAAARTISVRENKKAVEAGAVRIDPDEVPNLKDQARERLNTAAPTPREIVQRAKEAKEQIETQQIADTVSEEAKEAARREQLTRQALADEANFADRFEVVLNEPAPDPAEVAGTELDVDPFAGAFKVDQVVSADGEVLGGTIYDNEGNVMETITGADVRTLSDEAEFEFGKSLNRTYSDPANPTIDSVFDSIEITPYVHIMKPTGQHADALNKLTTDPDATDAMPYVRFGSHMLSQTVRRDGTDTGNPGPAWMEVNPELWIKVIEISEQVGSPIDVKQGFTPSGGDLTSGNAILLDGRGLTEDDVVETIIAASRAGVLGIVVLSNNDIILDDFQGRMSYYDGVSDFVLEALNIHEQNQWISWRPAARVQ